jgi:hypothetical protein
MFDVKLTCLIALAIVMAAISVIAENGQHDFDWEFGNWHTHLWRLKQPLTGSNEWAEYDGTTVVRKIWDGRANDSPNQTPTVARMERVG